VVVRRASADDAVAIARVRNAGWHAAYRDLLPADVISAVVADNGGERMRRAFAGQPWRTTLLAEAVPGGEDEAARGTATPAARAVGFASFGPERDPSQPLGSDTLPPPAGTAAELYSLYVAPAWWSAGVGRRLLATVTGLVAAQNYRTISLWVLAGNERARRFYERAGFTATGEHQAPGWLAGAGEVRYRRPLPGAR